MNRRKFFALLSVFGTLVLTIAVGAALTRYFVFPRTDPVAHTDVVFVIGPPTPSRIALAEQLMDQGVSSNLIVSAPVWGPQSISQLPICNEKHTYTVYCARPDPFTTQGEAEYLRWISDKQGWHSATIITFTPHVTRARLLMERCFSGSISMVADRAPLSVSAWAYQFAYQSAALVKLFTVQNC